MPPKNGMVERKNRPCVRWLRRSSTSIALLEGSGLRRSITRAMFRTRSTSESMLTVNFRQPSHEFTFGVDMNFMSYPLVLTPLV
jgi:hypothetical protein